MEKIYIGFSKRNGSLISKMIQLTEGSEYSHVYIRKESKYGEYVYQASGLQVNFMNIEIFKANNVIIEEYEFELSDDKKEAMLTFFIKYAGAPYQLKSLFELLLILIGRKFGIKFDFKGEGDQEFICSELGALFSEIILDIDVPGILDFVTPKDLNPIIKQYGKRIV